MVVDDSPFGLELTVQALQRLRHPVRYACRSAGRGHGASCKTHPIDLLLVDCEMPGMDGYELVRWLRRSGLEPNAFVPVIMTAGHVRRSKVAEARDCGANFLVTKPFSAASCWSGSSGSRATTAPSSRSATTSGPDRRFRHRNRAIATSGAST